MSQLRYNPKIQKEEWYYRIKESYRDLTGRPRNRVMQNVGFITEARSPEDIRDIGKCLTYRYTHQDQKDLFESPYSRYNEFAQKRQRSIGQRWSRTAVLMQLKRISKHRKKRQEAS